MFEIIFTVIRLIYIFKVEVSQEYLTLHTFGLIVVTVPEC